VGPIMPGLAAVVEAAGGMGRLAGFRAGLWRSFGLRADVLFELCDAVLCAPGSVRTLVELCLEPVFRRGHGALYDGLACGTVDAGRLREELAGLPVPRDADGRITLAVDVSNWLRPDASTSAERAFCHVYGRGKGNAQMIPGWPYSFVVALEPGRTSWTAVLDVVRPHPDGDATAVTAGQVEAVVERLAAAGAWRFGDPDILVVFDAGYDVVRLAHLLAGLPVAVLGRMRSDRVLSFPVAPGSGRAGRPALHGPEFKFADSGTWPAPAVLTAADTARYGRAVAKSWDRLHPRLVRRSAWAGHDGDLPIVEGTVIRLEVDRLPGDRTPDPVWLWWSGTGAVPEQVDRLWQSFLRRFDIEHMFRMWKQTLGWTAPKVRTPEQADRWTWLIVAAYTQLRLARPLVEDCPRPWERSAPRVRLSPARVRRGFRYLHATTPGPAGAPQPSTAGPGRRQGSKNRQKARHHSVGKTPKPDTEEKAGKEPPGY
jgi:hypothetical protein